MYFGQTKSRNAFYTCFFDEKHVNFAFLKVDHLVHTQYEIMTRSVRVCARGKTISGIAFIPFFVTENIVNKALLNFIYRIHK